MIYKEKNIYLYMVENWEKIKTYHCKGCQQNVNILLWRKTHNSFGYFCENCTLKIDKRLSEIKKGF